MLLVVAVVERVTTMACLYPDTRSFGALKVPVNYITLFFRINNISRPPELLKLKSKESML
jgi:hypothetical protein